MKKKFGVISIRCELQMCNEYYEHVIITNRSTSYRLFREKIYVFVVILELIIDSSQYFSDLVRST